MIMLGVCFLDFYVDWKTSLSRFNIAGPKPGKGGGLC
jgi:hypothetical protein